MQEQPSVDETTKDVLRVVFSRRGSYVQTILVDELVASVDALSREALSQVFQRILGSLPALVSDGMGECME
jgi:aarF domain-containing kinase